jgi:hypothetical protein
LWWLDLDHVASPSVFVVSESKQSSSPAERVAFSTLHSWRHGTRGIPLEKPADDAAAVPVVAQPDPLHLLE